MTWKGRKDGDGLKSGSRKEETPYIIGGMTRGS